MREVLIISQNSSVNQLLKPRLEKEGYSVETVEDGNIGLQKAKGGQYAIILIDFNLPETTGPKICYVLKYGSMSSLDCQWTSWPISTDIINATLF